LFVGGALTAAAEIPARQLRFWLNPTVGPVLVPAPYLEIITTQQSVASGRTASRGLGQGHHRPQREHREDRAGNPGRKISRTFGVLIDGRYNFPQPNFFSIIAPRLNYRPSFYSTLTNLCSKIAHDCRDHWHGNFILTAPARELFEMSTFDSHPKFDGVSHPSPLFSSKCELFATYVKMALFVFSNL
jgi:hypothetical protein